MPHIVVVAASRASPDWTEQGLGAVNLPATLVDPDGHMAARMYDEVLPATGIHAV
jgi:hypothetical protein